MSSNDCEPLAFGFETQDLKIASLALANDALLLSANLRDFEQVSGLSVESWLDG